MLRQLLALIAGIIVASASIAATEVQVLNTTTGERLPTYRHKGQLWVAGNPGDRYAVRLVNQGAGRTLSVVSVDGINVISGETASTSQRGYVLSPSGAVDISGWRKSENEVAAFYFTAVADSYAGRTQRPDNVGIIGVATFREYQAPAAPQVQSLGSASESLARGRSDATNSASADKAEAKLGTGHGERLYSPVRQVEFRRASSTPDDVVTIRYDSYANLVSMGVIRTGRVTPAPRAFPGGFTPDPS